jgi:hypothetical protein
MSLNLLRSGQLSAMTDLETRLAFLPQLAEVLANSTSYGAIYAGYEDGDFFLVRKLTERARGALEAPPPESRLLVQSLHQGQGEFLYFDQRLRLLERRPMPDYRFDPRDRGWYKEARWSTGIIVTHPYLFFTTREPGMTLAVESDDRRAVIGLDAGVEGLSSLIGDQPEAIKQLLDGLNADIPFQTLLGVTGSGKTFTIANVINEINRPTLVLSHNKTLAAQLYSEFKNFFPENAVEYFVSYYDYYQPEAYLPVSDTYIEKDLSINQEIEKLRLATTSALSSPADKNGRSNGFWRYSLKFSG